MPSVGKTKKVKSKVNKAPVKREGTSWVVIGHEEDGTPKRVALSKYQIKFAQNYVSTGNYAQSVILAGSTSETPSSEGSRMMKNEKIKAYVDYLQEEQKSANRVTATMIVDELKETAFFDVFNVLKPTEDGKNFEIDLRKAVNNYGKNIKAVKRNAKGYLEVQFYDKLEALEKLAKYIGFYELDNKQKTEDALVQFYLPDNGRGGTEET